MGKDGLDTQEFYELLGLYQTPVIVNVNDIMEHYKHSWILWFRLYMKPLLAAIDS